MTRASVVLAAMALVFVAAMAALTLFPSTALAAKAYCDGGECCADRPSYPGYTCYLSGFICSRGATSCTEQCDWTCVQGGGY